MLICIRRENQTGYHHYRTGAGAIYSSFGGCIDLSGKSTCDAELKMDANEWGFLIKATLNLNSNKMPPIYNDWVKLLDDTIFRIYK